MSQQKTAQVNIFKLSKKGIGVGSCESYTKHIEIRQTYPGEQILCQITKKKQGTYQGVALEILKPHPDRVNPRCQHAAQCGGCTYQSLDYAEQLRIKQRGMETLFGPFLADATVYPIQGMEEPWRFRNKMEWTFFQGKEGLGQLGLIEAGTKGRVFDVHMCHLCPEWMTQILHAVRVWWEKHPHVQAYHRLKQTGTLHLLTTREGVNTQEKMVILTIAGEPTSAFSHAELESFKQAILQTAGPDVSLFLQIKHIQQGTQTYFTEMLLSGKDHIHEELFLKTEEGQQKKYTFKISPSSFFQPNTKQAQVLFSLALKMIRKKPDMRILDLYAGTGTLGIIFAACAKEVISIELNPYATFDAQVNAEACQVKNLRILQGDVQEVIEKKVVDGKIDLVILDPPRSGLGPKVVTQVLAFEPEQILYISCNPYTQLEDVTLFTQLGYCIQAMQAVDQFAHGPHLENIVILEKKR
jgi:23S rRNA (uracil1939-C5)-methyltransferase